MSICINTYVFCMLSMCIYIYIYIYIYRHTYTAYTHDFDDVACSFSASFRLAKARSKFGQPRTSSLHRAVFQMQAFRLRGLGITGSLGVLQSVVGRLLGLPEIEF